jgi:hypothetical protein
MLHAIMAKNPGMHFKYIPKPGVMGPEGRQYFLRAFWTFGQCTEVFKHCCDMLSIDGTFLTGKYEGTMLIVIGIDVDRQLLPLQGVRANGALVGTLPPLLGCTSRLLCSQISYCDILFDL